MSGLEQRGRVERCGVAAGAGVGACVPSAGDGVADGHRSGVAVSSFGEVLDYLEDHPTGSGYWSFTTASEYWETAKAGPFHGAALGGRELHVTEVGARVRELHGLRFPHLTAVSYEVTRVVRDSRWSARFPGYIVH